MKRCEHTGLYVEECGHCKGLDDPHPPQRAGEAFEARFSGRCRGVCDSGIEVGDRIVSVGDWGYKHEEC